MPDREESQQSSDQGGGATPTPRPPPPIDDECAWVALEAKGWQEGEQGVLEAIAAHLEPHIPEESRWCVEFGAGDAFTLPLTVAPIIECEGWTGLLVEPNPVLVKRLVARTPKKTVVVEGMVNPDGDDTIDDILSKNGAPPNPAVMVVDVDGMDYFIVENMASRPAILCVEQLDQMSPQHAERGDAPHIPAREDAGQLFDDEFGTHNSANAAAFDLLLGGRGYSLVFRTRYNSIYVRGDMVPRLRKKKLNLGAGVESSIRGYEPVDLRVNNKDVRKLENADNTIDECYASHTLEHFGVNEAQDIVNEWSRVLKPNGTMRIAVPDVRKCFQAVLDAKSAEEQVQAMAVVYGSQTYDTNFHKYGYTEEILRRIMNTAGIGFVRPWKSFASDCSNRADSLNLMGEKRWWPKIENPKVVMILNQPRLAFTGHEHSVVKTALKYNFEVEFSRGAFWDRDMTITTQFAIEKHNPDFLFYADYDSYADADDYGTLLDTINNDPTMAAIVPVQPSRHDDKPLLHDANQIPDNPPDVMRVRFGHFGGTCVRPQVFQEMGWSCFWSVPGKNAAGEWDWLAYARSDADISFWRNMEMYGFRVYQHNKVHIGHIIQAVKFCRGTKKGIMLTPIENVLRHGKPTEGQFKPELFNKKKEEDTKLSSLAEGAPGTPSPSASSGGTP